MSKGFLVSSALLFLLSANLRAESSSSVLTSKWSYGLSLQKLAIDHGTPTAESYPSSVMWAVNIWGERDWDLSLGGGWSLTHHLRLGTERFYRKFIWFLYASGEIGPQYALSKSWQLGCLLGYRYDQELQQAGVGTVFVEHELTENWGLRAAGRYSHFFVPEDSGVSVKTSEFELAAVYKI